MPVLSAAEKRAGRSRQTDLFRFPAMFYRYKMKKRRRMTPLFHISGTPVEGEDVCTGTVAFEQARMGTTFGIPSGMGFHPMCQILTRSLYTESKTGRKQKNRNGYASSSAFFDHNQAQTFGLQILFPAGTVPAGASSRPQQVFPDGIFQGRKILSGDEKPE